MTKFYELSKLGCMGHDRVPGQDGVAAYTAKVLLVSPKSPQQMDYSFYTYRLPV